MRQLAAFTKKEFLEVIRTGKFYILLVIFIMFGIMNPAMAKLTPWILQMLSENMKQSGIVVGDIVVTAMTAWEQYYKNFSMELIVFVLMLCGILASEYQKGTLINMLTKGLPRWKVIASKSATLLVLWTLYYWLTFLITYGYTAYFWDNSIVNNIFVAALCPYLFGLWVISLIMLLSAFLNTPSSVLLSTGAVYSIVYLLSVIPKLADYLPTKLNLSMALLTNSSLLSDYTASILITVSLILISFSITILTFNKKKLWAFN